MITANFEKFPTVKNWVNEKIKELNRATGLGIAQADTGLHKMWTTPDCKKVFEAMNENYTLKHEYEKYNHAYGIFRNGNFMLIVDTRGTTTLINNNSGKVAIAKCNKKDRYNPWFGIAVTWCKYTSQEITESMSMCRVCDLPTFDGQFKFDGHNYEIVGTNRHLKNGYKIVAARTDGAFKGNLIQLEFETIVQPI